MGFSAFKPLKAAHPELDPWPCHRARQGAGRSAWSRCFRLRATSGARGRTGLVQTGHPRAAGCCRYPRRGTKRRRRTRSAAKSNDEREKRAAVRRKTLIGRSSATRAVLIALVGAVAVTIVTGCGEDEAAKRYGQSVSAPLARMDGVVADARRAISSFESGEASFGNTEDRMTDLASRARSLKDRLLTVTPPTKYQQADTSFDQAIDGFAAGLENYRSYLENYVSCNSNLDTYRDLADIDREYDGYIDDDAASYLSDAEDAAESATSFYGSFQRRMSAWSRAVDSYRAAATRVVDVPPALGKSPKGTNVSLSADADYDQCG
jgi:hypothetical protein